MSSPTGYENAASLLYHLTSGADTLQMRVDGVVVRVESGL